VLVQEGGYAVRDLGAHVVGVLEGFEAGHSRRAQTSPSTTSGALDS
jgi:hypothetical protein